MTATLLIGDVFDRLAELETGSVDLVVTSPPFLALRSYLPAGHPDKGREIGSEATPAEYLDVLLKLTAEWGRVLAPHGSLAVELGDTYSGSGGAGGDYNAGGMRDLQPRFAGSGSKHRMESARPGTNSRLAAGAGWPLEKSLVGIPEAYMLSLAYGRNVLSGEESPAGMWRVRNVVAWVRPNPPVGALADKFRPATSYIAVATRARDRWFDLDAVRTPAKYGIEDNQRPSLSKTYDAPGQPDRRTRAVGENGRINSNAAGSPPLDWWEIPPGGYRGAHYAVFPAELPSRLIDSMCPRRVCTTCGQPSRRIVGEADYIAGDGRPTHYERNGTWQDATDGRNAKPSGPTGVTRVARTTGWSSCGCPCTDGIRLDGFHTGPGWRPGIVLDPFVGSGTTLAVASGMGRDSVGIDLDPRNADLARERVGMFLEVAEDGQEATA